MGKMALTRVGKKKTAKMSDDGEYPWNAAETFHSEDLKDGNDYSLMLWSDQLSERSVSGYFSLQETPSSGSTTVEAATLTPAELDRQQKCLDYLASDGGYYNQSLDLDFTKREYYLDSYENNRTGWAIGNTGVGTTTLTFEGQSEKGVKSMMTFNESTMDLISSSTLGRGTFSLSMLQAARNAVVQEMNVIALSLGIPGHAGSVVLGGYDQALIDDAQRAVFAKGDELPYAFRVTMIKLSVQSGGSTTAVLDDRTNADSRVDVGLVYDDYGLRLSDDIIDSLLPLIGNPKFDKDVNGYVYDATPKTDYSLSFTLYNGSAEVVVGVPASSLVVTDTSSDNPLTPRNETGKTYLRISPTADGSKDGQYLGRSFLQHVYMIDSPSSIGKFVLSALPSTYPNQKQLIAASPSSIGIFNGEFSSSSNGMSIGPMVGGIVGGIAVLAAAIFGIFWYLRRRSQRFGRHGGRHSINITDASSYEGSTLGHIAHHHRGEEKGMGSVHTNPSARTTATIPIRYAPSSAPSWTPSYDKGSVSGYPCSPQPQSPGAPHIMTSQPVISFSTQSSSHNSVRSSSRRGDSVLSVPQSAMMRRNSTASTVAREYDTMAEEPEPDDFVVIATAQPIPQLYRSATVGKMYKPGKAQNKLTPPHTPGIVSITRSKSKSSAVSAPASSGERRGHARTASLGRIMTPSEGPTVVTVGPKSPKSPKSTSRNSVGILRSSISVNGGSSGSLEKLREEGMAIEMQARPQSTLAAELDCEDHHRRSMTQTQSGGALSSTRFPATSISSGSRAESVITNQEVNFAQMIDSSQHSRTGSSHTEDELSIRVRGSSEEGFRLNAVQGDQFAPGLSDGWLASSGNSETSGTVEKPVRQEQFLSSAAESRRSSRRSSKHDGRPI